MDKLSCFVFLVSVIFILNSCGSAENSGNDDSSYNSENTDSTELDDEDITIDEDVEEIEYPEDDSNEGNDPCQGDPCKDMSHSNGTCTESGDDFICGCVDNYEWSKTSKRCVESVEECTGTFLCPGIEFSGGSGTIECPYHISTPEDMNNIRNCLKGNFIQLNDIDLGNYLSESGAGYNDGKGWDPIGTGIEADADPELWFQGSYDGREHVIENLHINRVEGLGVGLFGVSQDANLSNITIKDADITGDTGVGILTGTAGNCKVFNVVTSGKVKGSMYVGGMSGGLGYSSTVTRCNSNSFIEGITFVGGLSGSGLSAHVLESFSSGTVKGVDYVGGLISYIDNNTKVVDCYSSSDLENERFSGGLIGQIESGSVTNCYSCGSVLDFDTSGGLIGDNNSSISTNVSNSFWDLETSGMSKSGGGEGKSTSEMKKEETFTGVGWDFEDVWEIDADQNNGYPVFMIKKEADCEGGDFESGSGTQSDPYKISLPEHLDSVRSCPEGYFVITADIDLTDFITENGGTWNPIGSLEKPFSGSFDGGDSIISGLTIEDWESNYLGLFGYVSGGILKNIGIEEASIKGHQYVGLLAGYILNGSVSGIELSGSSTASSYAGSIAGMVDETTITNCISSGSVGTLSIGGGLIGAAKNSEINKSSSTGNVHSDDIGGGLIGDVDNCEVYESFSTGAVEGNYFLGGMSGFMQNSVIEDSYSLSDINGYQSMGGFVGRDEGASNYNTIKRCYSAGSVSGSESNYAGGFIGEGTGGSSSKSFWDTESSGQQKSLGGVGKTTAEMKTEATFTNAGWDFDKIWNIDGSFNEGYPFLIWQEN